MSKNGVILIGAGGHARSCIDVIEQDGRYRVAGLIGKLSEVGGKCNGYTVLAGDDELQSLSRDFQYALVAVGQTSSATLRIKLFLLARSFGFKLPVIIAPTAYVSRHALIGDGSIVMHGATVNASAKVGSNCIINSHSLIEHDAVVADHCHISTGAIVNGSAQVGMGSFLGSGAILRDGKTIGTNCVIGMGQQVLHNLESNTIIRNQKHV